MASHPGNRRMPIEIHMMPEAGFCFGVERAVERAVAAAKEAGRAVYTLGEVVHNPVVVQSLEALGIQAAELEEIPPDVVVVIRSHGVSPHVEQRLTELNVDIIDATCPRVRRVQLAAEKYREDCQAVVIVGRKDHPEVQGVLGRCGDNVEVVNSPQEAEHLPFKASRAVLFQTTFNPSLVDGVVDALRDRTGDLTIEDTLCPVVRNRRDKVRELAEKVDALVVVGGSNSSNTNALMDIGIEAGKTTLCVETANELDLCQLKGIDSLAVVGGTSTPRESILEVCERIRSGE